MSTVLKTDGLRVLVFPDFSMKREKGKDGRWVRNTPSPDVWTALCLEHLIVGSGATVEEAQDDFQRSLRVELRLGDGKLSHIPPTKGGKYDEYHKKWIELHARNAPITSGKVEDVSLQILVSIE